MNCFFASRAFLKITALLTLTDQMRVHRTNLYALTALAANGKHGAGIEIMHIFVVLLNKSFVNSFTKLADLVLIYDFF